MAILIDLRLCTGCACCLDACDQGALELSKEPEAAFEQPVCTDESCTECEDCLELCPAGALTASPPSATAAHT
jgi:ferredoxin